MAADEESSQMGRDSADLDTSSPIGEWAGNDNRKGGQENTGTKEEVTGGGKRKEGRNKKKETKACLMFPPLVQTALQHPQDNVDDLIFPESRGIKTSYTITEQLHLQPLKHSSAAGKSDTSDTSF